MCRPISWRTPAGPFADGELLVVELVLHVGEDVIGGRVTVKAGTGITTAPPGEGGRDRHHDGALSIPLREARVTDDDRGQRHQRAVLRKELTDWRSGCGGCGRSPVRFGGRRAGTQNRPPYPYPCWTVLRSWLLRPKVVGSKEFDWLEPGVSLVLHSMLEVRHRIGWVDRIEIECGKCFSIERH